MYIIVLLIHPCAKDWTCLLPHRTAELHFFSCQKLQILLTVKIHKLHRKSIATGKFTQLPSKIYIYHSIADYGLVPDSLEGLSVFCGCSLITGLLLCMLGSKELCIPFGGRYLGIPGGWGTVITSDLLACVSPTVVLCVCNPCIGSPITPCEERYPGVPGGWGTVIMSEPLGCVLLAIILCICNPCIGCPIIPCGGRHPGVPSRRGTVELVDPLKQWSPGIVLWVCNPYSEGSSIPWREGSAREDARLWLKSCAVLTGAPTNTGPDEEK